MLRIASIASLVLAGLLGVVSPVRAEPARTVCTITVNSSDEAEAFRRALPADRYRFVELVAKGRPDWLASACRRRVRCDVLVVSGHYDGEGMFFSDRVDRAEHLAVNELERVACSEACPGLFDRLQQVYLFGCHTLAPGTVNGTITPAHSVDGVHGEARRVLGARHGESSRDRMSRIFKDVPVIFGFSGVAPLGPAAGSALSRWLRTGGTAEVGTPRASPRLLAHFAAFGMTSTRGITEQDARIADRRDVCRFEDERATTSQRAAFVRQLLDRDMREVRVYLDHVEHFVGSLTPEDRATPAVAAVLGDIAGHDGLRERFLAYARNADEAALRARLIALAHDLGWLDAEARQAEWIALLMQRLERGPRAADVDLACRLGRDGALAAGIARLRGAAGSVARDAMLACLGDEAARSAALQALAGERADEAEMARALLQHRPAAEAGELRGLAEEIARSDATPEVQALAIGLLARQPAIDARAVATVAELFPHARTLAVQRAIADVLIRSDLAGVDTTSLARMLRDHRLRSSGERDVIDVLIRRLGGAERHASVPLRAPL